MNLRSTNGFNIKGESGHVHLLKLDFINTLILFDCALLLRNGFICLCGLLLRFAWTHHFSNEMCRKELTLND